MVFARPVNSGSGTRTDTNTGARSRVAGREVSFKNSLSKSGWRNWIVNEKREPIEDDIPKHKKKSKKKGRPRADHKHEYKTVLLLNEYESHYFPGKKDLTKRPVKVCTLCGRVGDIDFEQYDLVEMHGMPYRIHERKIKDEESLEKWYVDDYFDKFAKKVEMPCTGLE